MNKRNWLVCIVSIILLLSCIRSYNIYSQNKPTEKSAGQIKLPITGKRYISCPEAEETPVVLLGFATLNNLYLPKTIQSLIVFQRNHPEIAVRGVLIISFPQDMELLAQNAYLWGQEIPVGADLLMEEVDIYSITVVPTFVFVDNNNNRVYKIAGQPDLEQVYNKYLKKKTE